MKRFEAKGNFMLLPQWALDISLGVCLENRAR